MGKLTFRSIRRATWFSILPMLLFGSNGISQNTSFVSDSLRIDELYTPVRKYCYTHLDSAFLFLDSIELLALRSGLWLDYVGVPTWKISCASYFEEYDTMAIYLAEAKDRLVKYKDKLDPIAWEEKFYDLRLRVGDYQKRVGKLEEAIQNFKLAIHELEAKKDLPATLYQDLIINYLQLGSTHTLRKNYRSSILCYQYCIDYEKERARKENREPSYGSTYSRLAQVYLLDENYEAAKENFIEAVHFYETRFERDQANIARYQNYVMPVYTGLAKCYQQLGQHASALVFAQKAFNYPGITEFQKAKAHLLVGELLSNTAATRADAAFHFSQAIQFFEEIYKGKKHPELATAYALQGDYYFQSSNWAKAGEFYQKAIINLVEDFNDLNVASNPGLTRVEQKRELLVCLQKKARLQFEMTKSGPSKRKNQLLASRETCRLGLQLMDSIRMENKPDYDKQGLVKDAYPLFEVMFNTSSGLGGNYLLDAYEVIEKSKAMLLQEAIQKAEAVTTAGVAENKISEERSLKEQISQLTNNWQEAKAKGKNIQAEELQNRVFELNQKLFALQDKIEMENPSYHRLKYSTTVLPVHKVKEQILPPHHALLEYFLHDTTAFIFIIDPAKEGLQIVKAAWNEDLANMATSITDDIFRRNDDAYERKALALFEHLLKPALGLTGADHLLIVPDGELWNVPFDALLTKAVPTNDKGRFKKYPYMLKEKTISYAFSATLQHRMAHPDQRPGGDFVVVAPAYRKIRQEQLVAMRAERGRMDTLWHNLDEASAIAKTCNGRLLAEGDATRSRFLQVLDGARMLHFGGHAKADHDQPDFSFIALSNLGDTLAEPYRLYAHELYNHARPLDLVVLSACETGTGLVWKGEGVISLARAFAHGGARSIVTTLWSINDGAARDIMALFYQYLADGMDKDEALRQAKLAYLNADGTDNERSHPFYWAAFTPIGDMAPVEFGLPWWKKGLAGAFLIGLAGAGILFFKKKQREGGSGIF